MIKINKRLFQKLSRKDFSITVPTVLTMLRLLLIPVIVVSMVLHYWGISFWLFLAAIMTDVLDGILARLMNQRTFLGACLDAVADKLLILSIFFTLAFVQSPLFMIPLWFVLLILLKEFLLIGGAITIFYMQGSLRVNPTWLGKFTMVAQSAFIIWLFFCYFFHWLPERTYYGMLGLLLVLVLLSLIQYAKIGLSYIRQ